MAHGSNEYIGKELADLKRQVKQLQKGRLGNASMHGGGLPYYDDEGNLRAIFGDQGDGSWGAGVVSSPPQPTPTAPVVVQVDKYGRASATWDGGVVSGQVPRVHGRVDVYSAFSADGSEPALSEYQFAATIWEREGGTAPIVCPQPGVWFVRLQMVGADERTKGAMSDPATVDIEGLVDTDAIQAELDAAKQRLTAAEAEARQALDEVGAVRDEWAVEYPRLQQEIQDAQAAVADAEARLDQAQTGLDDLRNVRIPALQQRLSGVEAGDLIQNGAIYARHLATESVSAAIAEFLSVSAQDATVQNLAARIATLIELNASRITTGQLGAARINVDDLYANTAFINNLRAAVVTALEVTAERGFIGGALLADNTIDVAKLNVTEQMTAELAQFLVVNAGQIAANAIDGMTIRGGHLIGGSIDIGTPDATGQPGFAVNAQGRMRATWADVDGDITARSLALAGELRVGVGSSGEGGLVPDAGRLRLQGRMPRADTSARDLLTTGTTNAMHFTASNWVDNGTAVRISHMITYPAPAPSGSRYPIVSLHGDTANQAGPATVTSRAQNPGHFQAIVRSAGPSGTHGDVRIRYLAVWADLNS